MLITSRSYAEYAAMFDLGAFESSGRVLDCCAGASSFVAELGANGGAGIAVDPAYALPRVELEAAVRASVGDGTRIIDAQPDRFVWDWYGGPKRRDRLRRDAAARFLDDLGSGRSRYVAASLPRLPFPDDAFDLVVCSHLLFTWANVLDRAWHDAALREMVRVARGEVRVFPTVVQGTGERVPFLDELTASLRRDGHRVEVRRVPYVFQQCADEMLVLA